MPCIACNIFFTGLSELIADAKYGNAPWTLPHSNPRWLNRQSPSPTSPSHQIHSPPSTLSNPLRVLPSIRSKRSIQRTTSFLILAPNGPRSSSPLLPMENAEKTEREHEDGSERCHHLTFGQTGKRGEREGVACWSDSKYPALSQPRYAALYSTIYLHWMDARYTWANVSREREAPTVPFGAMYAYTRMRITYSYVSPRSL